MLLRVGRLDMELKVLQFVRYGALLHAGEVAACVVTGQARHGELVAGVHFHVVELISLLEDA